MRRPGLSILALGCAAWLTAAAPARQQPAGAQTPASEQPAARARPNVLFVVVDDLRTELGCYGREHVSSPRIDALAAEGFLFTAAYCQQALCAPSRASVLTGMRPDTTGVRAIDTHFRTALPAAVTLPQHFARHGYRTAAVGKVFHDGLEDPPSWTLDWISDAGPSYHDPESLQTLRKRGKGPALEAADAPEADYRDGGTTRHALERLRELAGAPFFLAVGYRRPHLPYTAPRAYFDRYDPEALPLAASAAPPVGAPEMMDRSSAELRGYADVPAFAALGPDDARRLMHGYCACVSFVDAQIGRLLDELARLELADDTIVVVFGDHGFRLGEHGVFGKGSVLEADARVPLVLRAPVVLHAPGERAARRIDALVELVDLYPTLCELAGLPLADGLEGTSFVPLLSDPERPWKRAAFTQAWQRKVWDCRSLRTARYRFARWRDRAGETAARELYDEQLDPGETRNLAGDPAHAALVAELEAWLDAGWQASRPP